MPRILRAVRAAAACSVVAAVLLAALLSRAEARDSRPGQFDYFVLSLSWSPTFCDGPNGDRNPQQCSPGRRFAFVVHGLWPQYDKGFPEYCRVPAPRLDRAIVGSMLDLMPAPRLVFHEWDKHGTCSGLGTRAYFETIRKARAAVKIPEELLRLSKPKMISPEELEAEFIKVNPGLGASSISVTCDSRRLNEVRICMSKDLQFRPCDENDRRACRRDQVLMPPVRGG